MGINLIIYWKTLSINRIYQSFKKQPWVLSLETNISVSKAINNYPKHKHKKNLKTVSETSPPQTNTPLQKIISPFLIGDAVKLGWKYIQLILHSCHPFNMLILNLFEAINHFQDIWNASGGAADEVEALFLFALLLDVEDCLAASASVSIGSPSSCSAPSSSTSPGSRTCIRMMVCLWIAEGVGIRLWSWGIGTTFALKILMRRLGKISFAREV